MNLTSSIYKIVIVLCLRVCVVAIAALVVLGINTCQFTLGGTARPVRTGASCTLPSTLAQSTHQLSPHVRRLLAKTEEGAAGNPDRTGRSCQESGWCVSPYRLFSPHHVPSATFVPRTGIQLLQAEDLKTWYFSIEVLGESLYKVHSHTLVYSAITAPLVPFV